MNKGNLARKTLPLLWFPICAAGLILIVCQSAISMAAEPANLLPAPALAAAMPNESLPLRGMTDLFREYEADRNNTRSFFQMPASEAYLDRLERLANDWRKRLPKVDFDGLDQAGKVDYLWLATKIRHSSEDVSRERKRIQEMAPLLAFRAPIETLEEARWKVAPLDCEAAATSVTEMAEQIKRLRERVEAGVKAKSEKPTSTPLSSLSPISPISPISPPSAEATTSPLFVASPAVALRAARAIQELQEALKAWFTFYEGYRPEFSWWLKKPYEEAAKQMTDYAKLLREEVAQCKGKDDDPLIGEPLGAPALAEQIRSEWLAYSAEELIAIAERQMAWCEREMKAAARQMKMGDDWKAALAKVKSDFAPPGQQDELIAQIAHEAIDFVRQRKMVTVPDLCEQTWRLTMLSPETMKTIPYAAYRGQHVMVAYANEEMKQEDKMMAMRGNNRHFMRNVIPHELIPGHHLQSFNANRVDGFRGGTPFYIEGWAFYCETRLWELGWAQTPEDRIGMLFWRIHRCARVIVSLKFHLGQMTPAQMADYLVARVGHEKFGATSEVRRYLASDPLYQCSYLIGGLQFRAMRLEVTSDAILAPREKMTEQQYHDTILREPAMPLELLRARIFKTPLARDSKPAWKFAE